MVAYYSILIIESPLLMLIFKIHNFDKFKFQFFYTFIITTIVATAAVIFSKTGK